MYYINEYIPFLPKINPFTKNNFDSFGPGNPAIGETKFSLYSLSGTRSKFAQKGFSATPPRVSRDRLFPHFTPGFRCAIINEMMCSIESVQACWVHSVIMAIPPDVECHHNTLRPSRAPEIKSKQGQTQYQMFCCRFHSAVAFLRFRWAFEKAVFPIYISDTKQILRRNQIQFIRRAIIQPLYDFLRSGLEIV